MKKGTELNFAELDYNREQRCGLAEVVLGEAKSASQIAEIMTALNQAGQNGFATRVSMPKAALICAQLPQAVYLSQARIITSDVAPLPEQTGKVAVICAGTSDIPVAEEAAVTAERMGAAVTRIFDVGVAGIHRILERVQLFNDANAIIVVAGMEGALPSVVGGLTDKPLIAVPTSIGYGASFQGVAALLGMLNSCAAGVTVVNIDNGFGAGVAAARINRVKQESR